MLCPFKDLFIAMTKFTKLKIKDLLKELTINNQNRKIIKKTNQTAMILHFGKCWTCRMRRYEKVIKSMIMNA